MPKRGYNQTCSVAGALDLLGERWTLLLIRELLTGPRRYGDLLEALPGIGSNLLAARLKSLAKDGIVTQHKLPPPAGVWVYSLTEAGQEIEPVLLELIRWGVVHGTRSGKQAAHRPGWFVLATRAFFRPERARGLHLACEFRVGPEIFFAEVRDGELHTGNGSATAPDVVVTTDPATFRRYESGESLQALQKSGKWHVEGRASVLKTFATLFGAPKTSTGRKSR